MKLLEAIIKPWGSEYFKIIFLVFLIWRLSLFHILIIAFLLISLSSENFLGGGMENYQKNPHLFAWANFDGEHYLSIAQKGYENLTHSFFPLYPLFTKIITGFSKDLAVLVVIGLIISNISVLASLFIFWKLVRLEYTDKIAFYSLLALILFPTSFYFGSLYTDSLFLLFAVASFYSARIGRWWLAGVFGALASATRINGILLLPTLAIEWWQHRKQQSILPLLLIPLGLLSYMFYLHQTTGDPLSFYNELSVYGEQRQGNFVLLPQVFYRYFSMILTVDKSSLIYWTIVSEVLTAILIVLSLIFGYLQKMRLSYLLYCLLSFILPTLTGSFSSMPRYILTMFPVFILFGIFLSKKSDSLKIIIFTIMAILLIINSALFLRGYWVA